MPLAAWPAAELELGPDGIAVLNSKAAPAAGEVITLGFRIRNNGARDAKNVLLRASLRPAGEFGRAVDHDARLNVPAGRTVTTTWTVQLPPATDWSVGAFVELDYSGRKRIRFEPDTANNSGLLELGAVPADRRRALEEWLVNYRAPKPARRRDHRQHPTAIPVAVIAARLTGITRDRRTMWVTGCDDAGLERLERRDRFWPPRAKSARQSPRAPAG